MEVEEPPAAAHWVPARVPAEVEVAEVVLPLLVVAEEAVLQLQAVAVVVLGLKSVAKVVVVVAVGAG